MAGVAQALPLSNGTSISGTEAREAWLQDVIVWHWHWRRRATPTSAALLGCVGRARARRRFQALR